MKDEKMNEEHCWRCKETFIPEKIYEFNGKRICCWHECPDGKITQVHLKKLPVFPRKY